MITVCVVDDDDSFCALLQAALAPCESIRLCGIHSSAEEALREVPRQKPAVVLLDVRLPGMDGIECLRQFRKLSPQPPSRFLVLSGYDDDQLVFEALQAGANGYLSKHHALSRDLPLAIQDVAGGDAVMSPNIARKVIERVQAPDALLNALSSRELEVLAALADGLMYKEIATRLSISLNTVRRHVGAIYSKLQVQSRTQATLRYLRRPAQWHKDAIANSPPP